MCIGIPMQVIEADPRVRRVYLINQDYSFGREVARTLAIASA